jgi:multiple sugar transport system ATP-binding protein
MAGLRIRSLRKSFGTTCVLDGVDLDVRDGEFLTLVGPSGCGKTTLLRSIAGLDHADAGSVSIGGLNVDAMPPKRRDVAMVFQSYALYPYMTVAQNIALPLAMRRLSAWQRLPLVGPLWPGAAAVRAAIDAEVRSVAESLGLGALLARRPAQLSGGQRQRVALGRAMVRRPQVFLMDEPLSNLDAKLRTATRAEIAELHRRLGTTFVYVTHDQVEAMTMSDRVALMIDGRVLQLAPPQEIYDDPHDLRVAEFIGTPKIDTLPAHVDAAGVRVRGEHWPVPVDLPQPGPLTVAVRPEWWRPDDGGDARACRFRGVVRHLEPLGGETLVHVRGDDGRDTVVARMAPARARAIRVGDPLVLVAPAERVLAFDAAGRRLRNPLTATPLAPLPPAPQVVAVAAAALAAAPSLAFAAAVREASRG